MPARELYLNDFATVRLNASGNGSVNKTPPMGVCWKLDTVGVSVSSNVLESTCNIYVGSASNPTNFVDNTLTGSTGDSTGKIQGTIVYPGQYVWAVWAGGDALATATMSLFGTSVVGYRSGQ